MSFINIHVASQAHMSVKNNQLVLSKEGEQIDYPLEDVSSVMIENLQTSISTYTLSKLAQNNVVTYICDEKHMPCACVLPFNSHYATQKVYRLQTSVSAPLKKQLWKDIVYHKILNQNQCLKLCGKGGGLEDLLGKIKSGDNTNIEAVAANRYFKILFGKNFTREQENNTNAALNYGYAIIRGAVARCVVSHGLLAVLGLKHSNTFNNYNLADDLMEVFRPFVDLCVYQNMDLKFDKNFKAELYRLLTANCDVQGAKYTLAYAVEIFVQSLVDSFEKGENKLKFPNLIAIEGHVFK